MENQTQSFIDPSYLKKGGSLPRKRFSFLTFFLLFILGVSLWIFLVTINILPNPYLPPAINEVFVPQPEVKGAYIAAEIKKNMTQALLDFFLSR